MKRENLTNEQLVTRIKAGGAAISNDIIQLWEQNQGMINLYVRKYTGSTAEAEDLFQEAYIALYNAVENYKEESGAFITYLVFWVKWRLLRYCEKNTPGAWVPVNKRRIVWKLRRVSEEFEQRFMRSPTFPELCDLMGISQRELKECYLMYRALAPVRLEAPIRTAEDEELEIGDTIPDGTDLEEDVIEKRFQEEMREAVTQELEKLPDDQRKAISLVYLEGMPQWKAGESMGLEKWQISDLIRKGFRKLNGTPAKRLRPYICDDALSAAYRGSFTRFKNSGISATENAAIINMSHGCRKE